MSECSDIVSWCDLIYLLNNTQNNTINNKNNRTTQLTTLIGKSVGRAPRLCELYPGICLTTEEKSRRNLSQGNRRVPVGTMKTEYAEQSIHNDKNT